VYPFALVGQKAAHICCPVADSVTSLGIVVGQVAAHAGGLPGSDEETIFWPSGHTQYLRFPIPSVINPKGHMFEFTQSPTMITPVQLWIPDVGGPPVVAGGPPVVDGGPPVVDGDGIFKAVIIICSIFILYIPPSVIDDSVVALLMSMFLYAARFISGTYLYSIISSIEIEDVSEPD